MRSSARDDGFALVWVLGCLLVIAIAITPFTIFARVQTKIVANGNQIFRYDLIADGLATLALAQSRSKVLQSGLPQISTKVWCRLDDYYLEVRLQDHAGLVDLNRASPALLTEGFRALGFEGRAANEIAVKVDAFRRPTSGEASSTNVKHAPFEAVAELREIEDLSSVETDRLVSRFTIYSDQSRISLALAPEPLAESIGKALDVDDDVERGYGLSTGIVTATISLWSDTRHLVGYAGKTVATSTSDLRLLDRRGRPDHPFPIPDFDLAPRPYCNDILGIATLG